MPVQRPRPDEVPRDLYEAVEALLLASGDGGLSVVLSDSYEVEVLRQRFAETRPIPHESEDAALWRATRLTFDNVAREAEALTRRTGETVRLARFRDLDHEMQRSFATGLRGVFMQMAQVARTKAPQ